MKTLKFCSACLVLFCCCFQMSVASPIPDSLKIGDGQPKPEQFNPGALWYDESGELINAHGGGLLQQNGRYYWYGEKRGKSASEGVNVYSSTNLYNWKYEGLALSPIDNDTTADIARGCLMERPKVLYNALTGKYVMWFHLELRGKGYSSARAAVAVSDKPIGPFKFVSSFRPNGNMSRDMTLYQDEDGTAYHIYSSRENYDLRIARLSNDYLGVTTQDSLLFSLHREAPALFKSFGKYYLITSGCTGWAPNKASVHVSTSIWGPWTQMDHNPMQGPDAESTFGGQSTFVLPLQNGQGNFIFMADRWNPTNLKDSRYLWLPMKLEKEKPVASWKDTWSLQK